MPKGTYVAPGIPPVPSTPAVSGGCAPSTCRNGNCLSSPAAWRTYANEKKTRNIKYIKRTMELTMNKDTVSHTQNPEPTINLFALYVIGVDAL